MSRRIDIYFRCKIRQKNTGYVILPEKTQRHPSYDVLRSKEGRVRLTEADVVASFLASTILYDTLPKCTASDVLTSLKKVIESRLKLTVAKNVPMGG